MTLTIRTYQDQDQTAVTELWREVFADAPAHNQPEDDIRRKQAVQSDLFFLAFFDKQLAGTAMAGYDGHRGWVYYVAVRPTCRRLGVGRALMQQVEQALTARHCPKLNLQVRADNEQAVAFYRKLGYDIEQRVSMGKKLL